MQYVIKDQDDDKQQSSSSSSAASVLLIDDEADILAVLKRSLERSGIKTFGFTQPELAVEHFKYNPTAYDVVVTDIRMPGMSGFQVARAIKKTRQQVKLILMTAFEIKKLEFEKVLPSIKADAILSKPIKPSAFLQVVNSLIKRDEKQIDFQSFF